MKKNHTLIIMLAVTIMFVLTACSNHTDTTESDTDNTPNEENVEEIVEEVEVNEEFILEKMKEAVKISKIWYGIPSEYINDEDVNFDEYAGMEWPYYAVTHPEVSTYQDLEELTRQYYTSEAMEYLTGKNYLEEGGKLYLPAMDGIGGIEVEETQIRITKEDEQTYHIIEKMTYDDPNMENEFSEYNCLYVDSTWVFDNVIYIQEPEKIVLDTNDGPENSEEGLHTVFEENIARNELYFYYDDFDNDGTYEAYGITGDGSEGDYFNVSIYYISSNGVISEEGAVLELYGYCKGIIDTGTSKFLMWQKSAGGSGSTTYLFGVRDGKAYQPMISGEVEWFSYLEADDIYEAETSDFSQGFHDYTTTYYKFDPQTGEFVEN